MNKSNYSSDLPDDVADLVTYKNGWAGEGSYGPLPSTIQNVHEVWGLLALLGITPDLTVTDNGTVEIEFAIPGGTAYIDMGSTKAGILIRRTGRKSWYINGHKADNELLEMIAESNL